MGGIETKKLHTDSQRRRRAAALFIGIVVVAVGLSGLFASALSMSIGIPQDQSAFLMTALQISTLVVVPLAAFAAQNDYRLSKYQAELEQFASTDTLTGLLNRRYFQYRLSEELQRMERKGEQGAIALFDIDHFKEVNDTFGHKAGDAVLKAVALAVSSELRGPMDRLARWGGEEFIILLSDLSPSEAKGVCERLRTRIEQTIVYHGAKKISCTASFGVSTLLAGDAPQDTIDSADVALYTAKSQGRNRTVAAPARAADAIVAANDATSPSAARRA
ncbi:MAG: GGDEF domain-containing protein [Pseudomonadota bacterium]